MSPCTIIVPSARHRSLTQRRIATLLEQFNLKLVFDLRIQAFYPFCESVLKAAHSRYRVLPEDLRALVLSAVLDRLRATEQLQHLGKLARFQGTSAALLKLIDEFQRAGYTPARILSKLAETSADTSRYAELATVYDAYWRELDRLGCIDQKRIAFEAREILFSRRLSDFHHGMILIEGFDRISPLQSDIMSGLAKYAEAIWMSFDYVEQADEASGGPTYEWNQSSFDNLVTHMKPQVVHQSSASAKLVATTGEHIGMFRALDRYAEMREIAARCKEAIRLRETRPAQLMVVARHIDKYRSAIESAFEDAGVPYFLDHSIAAEELPFIQFIRDLLNLPLKNSAGLDFVRPATIACLRNRFLNTTALGMTPPDLEYLDSVSLESAMLGGSDQWTRVLSRCNSEIHKAVDTFFSSLRALCVQATCVQHCATLEDLLEKLVMLPSAPAPDVHNKVVQQSRQGERILRRALKTLIREEQLLDNRPVSFKEFLGKLETLLLRANFTASGGNDAVLITSADTAPNECFSEIFIAGLVEGEFPRRGGQAGFAGQDELARWGTFGIDLSNPRAEPGFETALYRSLFARADKVTLSYPQFEMAGDEKTPSFFIAEAQGTQEPHLPLTEPMARARSNPVSAASAIAGWLWYRHPDHSQLPATLSGQSEIAGQWSSLSDAVTAGLGRLKGGAQSVYNGYLVPLVESQALKVAAKDSWSATQLNNYGQCPFKYWLAGVLHYSPRAEGSALLSPKLQGMTYHKVLEMYYRRLSEENIDHTTGVQEITFQESVSAAFAWLCQQPDFSPGPYWSNEQQDIRLRLHRFLQWESESRRHAGRPQKFEVKFGRSGDQSEPPLVLHTESAGDIKISGAIDRIDFEPSTADDGPRVVHLVDYKSGGTPMKTKDALDGINIQLPLYALAVENQLLPASTVASASYLSVRQAKATGSFNFKAQHMDVLNVTRQHVSDFVRRASSGDFRVSPANKDVCKNCEHQTVCRIAELRQARKTCEGADD